MNLKINFTEEDIKEKLYEVYKTCRKVYLYSWNYTPKQAFISKLTYYYHYNKKEANLMYSYVSNRYYLEYRKGAYCPFPPNIDLKGGNL